ncbi:hypothetical protein C8R45DRAFT_1041351 [Mycena sanguinolenta]|nr:hypothetical protein C8R45DRAFT_1041351 [Mycena sanguinolenta]
MYENYTHTRLDPRPCLRLHAMQVNPPLHRCVLEAALGAFSYCFLFSVFPPHRAFVRVCRSVQAGAGLWISAMNDGGDELDAAFVRVCLRGRFCFWSRFHRRFLDVCRMASRRWSCVNEREAGTAFVAAYACAWVCAEACMHADAGGCRCRSPFHPFVAATRKFAANDRTGESVVVQAPAAPEIGIDGSDNSGSPPYSSPRAASSPAKPIVQCRLDRLRVLSSALLEGGRRTGGGK